jgi:hypothetical protein
MISVEMAQRQRARGAGFASRASRLAAACRHELADADGNAFTVEQLEGRLASAPGDNETSADLWAEGRAGRCAPARALAEPVYLPPTRRKERWRGDGAARGSATEAVRSVLFGLGWSSRTRPDPVACPDKHV